MQHNVKITPRDGLLMIYMGAWDQDIHSKSLTQS